MSHSIVISIADKTTYLSTCDNLENKINKLKDRAVATDIRNQLNNLTKTINEIRTEIKSDKKYSNIEYMELLKNISTLEKNVANLFSAGQDEALQRFIESIGTEVNISEQIIKHGPLAIETLDYLEKNKIDVNQENFDKYITVVQEQNISAAKIEKYINEAFESIEETSLPAEIKVLMKKQIRETSSIVEIKDVFAIIQSKEDEYHRTMELSKKIAKLLTTQEFKVVGKSIWEFNEADNTIVHKFVFQNNSNKTVQMIIDSNNQLKYKLGNYVGHACEATTKKLLEDMKKCGMCPQVVSIKRDYEPNAQVMQMELPENKKGGK